MPPGQEQSFRRYECRRDPDGCTVTVNGEPLKPRLDLRNHSPTGFAWGYGGSGPAQLALALLADCLGPAAALVAYQDFKWQVICPQGEPQWSTDSNAIRDWYRRWCERQEGPRAA